MLQVVVIDDSLHTMQMSNVHHVGDQLLLTGVRVLRVFGLLLKA